MTRVKAGFIDPIGPAPSLRRSALTNGAGEAALAVVALNHASYLVQGLSTYSNNVVYPRRAVRSTLIMKLARKIQHRRHPSRQATQTKADDGEAKEDKEGDKEGETDETSDTKEKEMRRLPLQGKEKCGSPRVTLRIHQVKDKRDKKNSVDHDSFNGTMESGKTSDDNGNVKESSSVDDSGTGNGGGRSSPSEKDAAVAGDSATPASETGDKAAPESGAIAGVKRTHSTEDEASGGSIGEDGKKRRKKEDKGKSGSNSGGSPKSLVGDSEGEDAKSVESPGPKVPPLKIVISGASLEEPGSGGRNGKNGSGRHHLPYVVSASPEAPESSATPLPSQPTSDEPKEDRGAGSGEEGAAPGSGPASGAPTGPTTGGRGHQRVLRSHRGKKGSGEGRNKDKDKDSNSNSGSATSSPAGMGEVSSPRQVSPTPGAGSEIASEGEDKPSTGGTTGTGIVRGERESTSGRDSDVEKTATPPPPPPQELHPRKRKIRPREQPPPSNGTNGSHLAASNGSSNGSTGANSNGGIGSGPGSDSGADASLGGSIGTSAALESITNSYQLFLNIRKQIERKRKGLFPVQPKPPQGFKDYLMNRCTYVLANNNSNRVPPPSNKPPQDLPASIKELYLQQEKERHRLLMQHVIEKEKLVLSVEQEILRVHGRAARALANQALPFSACTILRDEEVYSAITPEQEEKDRNARSRYNGRLFLSWLQDVDDKWEKIKEAMLLRHHNEAESLHAVQKMDWEWKMKELGLCEMKSSPVIDETHVPVVHVSDDFDLLPA